MNYSEKLKDPRWQKKRLEIFSRDKFTCQICLSTEKTLHVHHKSYLKGKEPWDYDDYNLVTVCLDCHKLHHDKHPAIYVAGKINKWREYLSDIDSHKYDWRIEDAEFPFISNSIKNIYCGPFFNKYQHSDIGENYYNEDAVHIRNLKAIDDCTEFVGYIDSADAFGTFYEIGYAFSKNKNITIFLNCDNALQKDLWFVLKDVNVIKVSSPKPLSEYLQKIARYAKEIY